MLQESHPLIRRFLRFLALPYCYFKLVDWDECNVSRLQVIRDMLYIFFRFRYFPDNYGKCRFWEKDRKDWAYYYGSTYEPYQRRKLRKSVQRYEYQILFNDKMVCDLLSRGIGGLEMPRVYAQIEPDQDYREIIRQTFERTKATQLIVKPILGHAGQGIVMAVFRNGGITIRNRDVEVVLEEFVLREPSIVQEVIEQDERISRIASSSVNTIRVVTFLTPSNHVQIVSSTMRFSSGTSYVDNWSAGGIAVGVDLQTGRLKQAGYDKRGKRYTEHPQSMVRFQDFEIPYWPQLLDVARKIQQACPFYRLIGMDIAVTPRGPVLIEINANTDIVFQEQTSGPLLADKEILAEFDRCDLLVNSAQKNLLKGIRS